MGLAPSSNDMLALVAELNCRRIAMVMNRFYRVRGRTARVPAAVLENMVAARKLHRRYSKGDYRHDEIELGKIKSLCEWLVATNAELSGAPPRPMAWDDSAMVSSRDIPAGRYESIQHEIAAGALDG